MARRRKKASKRERIPVIDTMLELAEAATLDYIAHKRRESRRGKKTKIDPYAATGAAFGLGMINDTEDLIKFGGVLGAMGAFDDDDDDYSFSRKTSNGHNKYAWRLNCQDGSQYGIYPEDYETRQEFNDAISLAKSDESPLEENNEAVRDTGRDKHSDAAKYTYCKVSRLDNGKNDYYLPGNLSLQVGDFVAIPTEAGRSKAVVILIQSYSEEDTPKPLAETEQVIEKSPEKEL